MELACKYAIGAGVLVSGCLACLAFAWWVRKSGAAHRSELYDDILKEVLKLREVPPSELGAALDVAKAEIRAGRRFSDRRMDAVFRIECVYAKAEKGCYGLDTLVYAPGTAADRMKVSRIKLTLDWAELPSDVRAAFIRDRSERVALLMYERKDDDDGQ